MRNGKHYFPRKAIADFGTVSAITEITPKSSSGVDRLIHTAPQEES